MAEGEEFTAIADERIEGSRKLVLVSFALSIIAFAVMLLYFSKGYGDRGPSSGLEWIPLLIMGICYWVAKLRFRCPRCGVHPDWTTMMSSRCTKCSLPLLPGLRELQQECEAYHRGTDLNAHIRNWMVLSERARRHARTSMLWLSVGISAFLGIGAIGLVHDSHRKMSVVAAWCGIGALSIFLVGSTIGVVYYLKAKAGTPLCPFCGHPPTLRPMPLKIPSRCLVCGFSLRAVNE